MSFALSKKRGIMQSANVSTLVRYPMVVPRTAPRLHAARQRMIVRRPTPACTMLWASVILANVAVRWTVMRWSRAALVSPAPK